MAQFLQPRKVTLHVLLLVSLHVLALVSLENRNENGPHVRVRPIFR